MGKKRRGLEVHNLWTLGIQRLHTTHQYMLSHDEIFDAAPLPFRGSTTSRSLDHSNVESNRLFGLLIEPIFILHRPPFFPLA
jgi:hypothetical protein